MNMNIICAGFFLFTSLLGCKQPKPQDIKEIETPPVPAEQPIIVGAEQFDLYLPALQGKRVGMVVNQSSMAQGRHLVDQLLEKQVDVKVVFAPEHGFRGTADAGEHVSNNVDAQTGLPIISLYGNNRKPTAAQLSNLDIVVYDLQDVGTRFYTYISTLEYVMEACAEQGIQFMVLDRPNPNGHYVDGPVLKPEFKSFVGMQQIPVVHGMTVAEYANFLNGEKLLKNGIQAQLTLVPCSNYNHKRAYDLPIAPSPNLPNAQSIALYPSLCFFEGTDISVGRGTTTQFQVIGSPKWSNQSYTFTPVSRPGATQPKFENQLCYGKDLRTVDAHGQARLNLSYLIEAYQFYQSNGYDLFTSASFFDKLAGSDQLRKQISSGLDEATIRASWQSELDQFKAKRKLYLLYPDFE